MTTSTAIAIIPSIDTLESEGLALAKMYKIEVSSEKRRFTQSIKMDQLSYRLGKLMANLSAEAEGGRISSSRLKEPISTEDEGQKLFGFTKTMTML